VPKIQVYLPDALYDQVKRSGSELNVSRILQEALTERLTHIERLRYLSEALHDFESEHGSISAAEIEAQVKRDRQSAVKPKAKLAL
jgi:post-segregation antitoxin (ccd killing protein)